MSQAIRLNDESGWPRSAAQSLMYNAASPVALERIESSERLTSPVTSFSIWETTPLAIL